MWTKYNILIPNYKPCAGAPGYGPIIIPAGTALTNMTAMGIDTNYHFVEDLSFIEKYYKPMAGGLRHDFYYRNYNVPGEHVTGMKELINKEKTVNAETGTIS